MDTFAIITAFSTRSEVLVEVHYEIANMIGDWVEQLRSEKHVKIPVGYEIQEPAGAKSTHILTFVDASQQAYGPMLCNLQRFSIIT